MGDARSKAWEARAAEVTAMYAALVRGELSGTDALTASQQMLQVLMDSMTNAVFWKDLNSCYLGCNRVFSNFAGIEPILLLGKSDRDMPWSESEDFSADWFIDWDRAVMESGEPRFGILERLRNAAGQLRWIETNKVPLRDLTGEIIGVVGTFEDVTERRHAEETLRRTMDELDERVEQRTIDLERANASLRREVEDRVRLQAEERQQRDYAEALRETAAAMSQTFNLAEVAEEVIAGVERLVSNDLTALVLVDDDTTELSTHRVGFGYEPLTAAETIADNGDLEKLSVIECLAAAPGAVILDDPERAVGPARSVLGVRVAVADQLIGYLFVESATKGFFTSGHADRLGAVADQAGSAISNSRLAGRSSELAAAEERQRLARDLHDAVNQALWTASLTAESLLRDVPEDVDYRPRIERLRTLTRGALSEMRSLLLELRPTELAQVGLNELIGQLLAALESRRTLAITTELNDVALDPEAHLALYRIAQEALQNVAQHAEADSLRVELTSSGTVTELSVRDDGKGFDSGRVPAGHLGLTIMRERAEAIGAAFRVDTDPGHGTTVTVRVG